jgi:UPF0716 family protein affecting phage T7 exclusion
VTTGSMVVRVLLGGCGLLLLIAGLALAAAGFVGAFFGALWLIVPGAVLIIVALIEVTRYRSQAAEQANSPPGPGGGETGPLEPRFRPTAEVFVDPTSKMRMRVYSDPRTGERRYVAEG